MRTGTLVLGIQVQAAPQTGQAWKVSSPEGVKSFLRLLFVPCPDQEHLLHFQPFQESSLLLILDCLNVQSFEEEFQETFHLVQFFESDSESLLEFPIALEEVEGNDYELGIHLAFSPLST